MDLVVLRGFGRLHGYGRCMASVILYGFSSFAWIRSFCMNLDVSHGCGRFAWIWSFCMDSIVFAWVWSFGMDLVVCMHVIVLHGFYHYASV